MKIVFCQLDGVLGPLWIRALKEQYGRIGVVHSLRADLPTADDVTILRAALVLSEHNVASTCWDKTRTIAAAKALGADVRVYAIGKRVRLG